jgi:hypothetical protein
MKTQEQLRIRRRQSKFQDLDQKKNNIADDNWRVHLSLSKEENEF